MIETMMPGLIPEPMPEYIVAAATGEVMRRRIRVFQGHRLADTEAGHMAALLDFIDPPRGSLIADLGCGIGEPAKLLHALRPDLSFVLVNRSPSQLDVAPGGPAFRKAEADYHATGLADASVDGAMFLYALCHGHHATALREAARITRPGGFLAIFDYELVAGDDRLFRAHLRASALSRAALLDAVEGAGWRVQRVENPPGDDDVFRSLFAEPLDYDAIVQNLRPVLIRAVRRTPEAAGGAQAGDGTP